MAWAQRNGYILFTNDLDFSVLLALSRESKPSVLQLRMQDLMPAAVGNLVVSVLHQHQAALDDGAILTVDASGSRVRILPLTPES